MLCNHSVPFKCLLQLGIFTFVFKLMNIITPVNFLDWFKLNHELHALKTKSNFNVADNTTTKNLFIPMVKTTESKWSKDQELFTY